MKPEELQTWEGRHQEVNVGNGRIIVTEESIVFSGGEIPLLADPVEELRVALDEVERLIKEINRVKLSITWRSVKRWREHFRCIEAYESELEIDDWELDDAVEVIKDCVNHARQALEGESDEG